MAHHLQKQINYCMDIFFFFLNNNLAGVTKVSIYTMSNLCAQKYTRINTIIFLLEF